MARAVPEDPFCGIADRTRSLARSWPDLDLDDRAEPSAGTLLALAREAEDAARAVQGVTNSEGAEAGWGRSSRHAGRQQRLLRRLPPRRLVAVLLRDGRRRHRHGARLRMDSAPSTAAISMAPATIGRNAGEFAVRRLNPRKVARAARAGGARPARLGRADRPSRQRHQRQRRSRAARRSSRTRWARRSSPHGIRIIDDPLRKRGLRRRRSTPRASRRRRMRGDRRRHADHLAARSRARPASSSCKLDRPRLARHRRAALAHRPPTSTSRRARCSPDGADRATSRAGSTSPT